MHSSRGAERVFGDRYEEVYLHADETGRAVAHQADAANGFSMTSNITVNQICKRRRFVPRRLQAGYLENEYVERSAFQV
jgi:hypothetical protein